MNIGDRIKQIRKDKDLTQQEFANRLNIPRNTIAGYEVGKSNPSEAAIALICREFGVNEEWLRNGMPPMLRTVSKKEEVEKFIESIDFDDDNFKARLVTALTKLDESQWKILAELTESLAEKKKESPYQPYVLSDNVRKIPYYSKSASAGTGQILFDDMPKDMIDIKDIPEYKKVSYAVGVNGSSMLPKYRDEDVLLVEATKEIEVGEIGIFIVENEAYVKQMGESELISLNKEYANIPLTESAMCMGRVVGKM